jgi:hypothetical protein
MSSEWLELELADQLAPVKAPDGLWRAVQAGVQAGVPTAVTQSTTRRRPIKTIALIAAAAAASIWMAAAWRPENRTARAVGWNAVESHTACRSCHID